MNLIVISQNNDLLMHFNDEIKFKKELNFATQQNVGMNENY